MENLDVLSNELSSLEVDGDDITIATRMGNEAIDLTVEEVEKSRSAQLLAELRVNTSEVREDSIPAFPRSPSSRDITAKMLSMEPEERASRIVHGTTASDADSEDTAAVEFMMQRLRHLQTADFSDAHSPRFRD